MSYLVDLRTRTLTSSATSPPNKKIFTMNPNSKMQMDPPSLHLEPKATQHQLNPLSETQLSSSQAIDSLKHHQSMRERVPKSDLLPNAQQKHQFKIGNPPLQQLPQRLQDLKNRPLELQLPIPELKHLT